MQVERQETTFSTCSVYWLSRLSSHSQIKAYAQFVTHATHSSPYTGYRAQNQPFVMHSQKHHPRGWKGEWHCPASVCQKVILSRHSSQTGQIGGSLKLAFPSPEISICAAEKHPLLILFLPKSTRNIEYSPLNSTTHKPSASGDKDFGLFLCVGYVHGNGYRVLEIGWGKRSVLIRKGRRRTD